MIFIAGDGGRGALVRLKDRTIHRSYSLAETQRYGTAFCPAEGVVVAFQARNSAFFFAPSTQQPAHRSFTPEQVTSCAVSVCGTFLVCGSQNGSVLAWSLKSGQLLKIFRGHLRSVTCISFSNDNSLVATASEDSVCKVWSLASLCHLVPTSSEVAPVSTLTGHTLSVLCCAFLHHTNLVVTGSADKTCRVFDSVSGEQLSSFTIGDVVTAVAASNDDSALAVGTQTGYLCFWQLVNSAPSARGSAEARFVPPSSDGHNSPVVFLRFIADSNLGNTYETSSCGSAGVAGGVVGGTPLSSATLSSTVLTASEGGAVLWYDARSCKLVGEAFPRQKQKIFSCTYFPERRAREGEGRVVLPGLSKNPMDPTDKKAYVVERSAKRPRKESHITPASQIPTAKATSEEESGTDGDEVLERVLAENTQLEALRAKMIEKLAKINH